ncbi:MAG TPA: hypothetical protein VLC55_06480 [Burkholderiales bacterium]|nr:hypothetical protein [Burkholderiales bacterium]
MILRHALALCLALAAGAVAAAEPLGRLFLTPEQRATLESLRLAPATAATTATDRIKVNGIIQRSGGPATVWINGVPQTAAPGSVAPSGHAGVPTVEVTVPAKDERVRLKVGQSIELAAPEAPEAAQPPAARQGAPAALREPGTGTRTD